MIDGHFIGGFCYQRKPDLTSYDSIISCPSFYDYMVMIVLVHTFVGQVDYHPVGFPLKVVSLEVMEGYLQKMT